MFGGWWGGAQPLPATSASLWDKRSAVPKFGRAAGETWGTRPNANLDVTVTSDSCVPEQLASLWELREKQ